VPDRTADTVPISNNVGMGRGLGFGRRRGLRRGLQRGYGPVNTGGFQANQGMSPQSNPQYLQAEIDRIETQAASMQRSLDAINARLADMEKNK
jgi:hypothetical protein